MDNVRFGFNSTEYISERPNLNVYRLRPILMGFFKQNSLDFDRLKFSSSEVSRGV